MKLTDDEIMLEGLNSLRSKVVSRAKAMILNLNNVGNPLEYPNFIAELIEQKEKYNEIETMLNELDPKRNEIPF